MNPEIISKKSYLEWKAVSYTHLVVSFSNPREEYIYNSAKRLVNMWFNFQSEDIYRVDFECSLRNYLLLVKKSITIRCV